jgi:hypothetical protein
MVAAPEAHLFSFNYDTEPFLESLFPGAGVGYSFVTERPLKHTSVNQAIVGYKTYEFFTAQNFPVIEVV